jgi:hypothetical protein
MRKLTEADVTFSLCVEQDDEMIRGNVSASKRVEEEILVRLDEGDVWAWASVQVIATLTLPDGTEITGDAHLGCCSYKNEDDFKQSGYYEQMKTDAFADLQVSVEREIARGAMLASMLSDAATEIAGDLGDDACRCTIGGCEVCLPSSVLDD